MTVFSTKDARNGRSYAKNKQDIDLIPFTKINSNSIKYLDGKSKTIKFLKETQKNIYVIFVLQIHFHEQYKSLMCKEKS